MAWRSLLPTCLPTVRTRRVTEGWPNQTLHARTWVRNMSSVRDRNGTG